jgi:glycosyltransferase involved in cell wall biosynthesis
MRLTVLNISYPLAQVSERTAGGAEQVLANLDEALVRAGHRSLVVAPLGSRCAGLVLPVSISRHQFDDDARRGVPQLYRESIHRARSQFSVDIVHLHGIDFLDYLPEPGIPVLVTLHLPPSWYPPEAFRLRRPQTYFVCVSESQAQACPPYARITKIIENGVRLDRFHPGYTKGSYVLSMGRICREKGFHLAIEAADAAGVPIWLAGAVFAYADHVSYFQKFIRPKLDHNHRFLGLVGGDHKRALLAGAKCLLVPSLAPETSSLVAMEAMACGTPVIAFRSGALCELIEHGRTGFLVETVQEMAEAISASSALDLSLCRRSAEARFSAETMVQQYLGTYQDLVSCSSSGSAEIVLSEVGC